MIGPKSFKYAALPQSAGGFWWASGGARTWGPHAFGNFGPKKSRWRFRDFTRTGEAFQRQVQLPVVSWQDSHQPEAYGGAETEAACVPNAMLLTCYCVSLVWSFSSLCSCTSKARGTSATWNALKEQRPGSQRKLFEWTLDVCSFLHSAHWEVRNAD